MVGRGEADDAPGPVRRGDVCVTETLPRARLFASGHSPGSAPGLPSTWGSIRESSTGHGGHRPVTGRDAPARLFRDLLEALEDRRRVSASSRRSTSSSGDRALSACAAAAAGSTAHDRFGARAGAPRTTGSATRVSQLAARGAPADSSKRTCPGSRLRGPRRASHRLEARAPASPVDFGLCGRPSQGID